MQLKLLDDSGKELLSMAVEVRGESKPFSSGALGFYAGGKQTVNLSGKGAATYQISASFVEVGTKNAERAKQAADAKAKKQASKV